MAKFSTFSAPMLFASCAGMLVACGDLQPLLEYETDLPHVSESVADDDGGSAEVGDGSESGGTGGDSETGDGDGDGSPGGGDGDGAAGDGDGASPICGDGVTDEGEECDDRNEDSADGCLANCTVPRSCLELHTFDGGLSNGTYEIAPSYPQPAFEVDCDMMKEGGGWTGLTLQHLCSGHLSWKVEALGPVENYMFDPNPCSLRTFNRGAQTHTLTVDFAPTFIAFYLHDYKIQANASNGGQSEIDGDRFIQSEWVTAYGDWHGDVSFGSPNDMGPITSYAAEGSVIGCQDCEVSYKANDAVYTLIAPSTQLRIGWGEQDWGWHSEGWYPWYAGTIYVR